MSTDLATESESAETRGASGVHVPGGSGRSDDSAAAEDESGVPVVDRSRVSTIFSITAVALAVGAAAVTPTYAIPGLLLAAVGVSVSAVKRWRAILGPSVGLGLASTLAHGAFGGSSFGTVAAAGLLVFAWDQVDNAFDLDAHLGADASLHRGEVAHALYSAVVFGVAGGGAYAVAFMASNQRPLPALVLLLLGAILLAAAVRDR